MINLPSYRITALGDTALIIDFGNQMDPSVNELIISLYDQIMEHPLPGMTEAVPAYSSLAIYYDVDAVYHPGDKNRSVFDKMSSLVRDFLKFADDSGHENRQQFRIPVCYDGDFGPDLDWIAGENKISKEEIIRLHTSRDYRVFMLGFLPGFAYMGILDQSIAAPRKPKPAPVMMGSVGIAGRQTGIYPFNSPGGWQIIGRCPVRIFNEKKKDPAMFHPGDSVRFYSINRDEFENLKSRSS
jgi:inhibitor of KinA